MFISFDSDGNCRFIFETVYECKVVKCKVTILTTYPIFGLATGTGARPKDSSTTPAPDRSLGEQAAALTSPVARISALRRTTHALRVTMARAVVMRALSLLALSGGSCDLWAGLEALGLCDVRLLVRLMWLVAQGETQL